MTLSIEEKLDNFLNNEARPTPGSFSLSAITEIMHHCGNPHHGLKSIHIAGTNGKGSVANFINQIFIEAGYKTGKFTSPHLDAINERIQLNNENIDSTSFHRHLDEIINLAIKHDIQPTYFDILTASAIIFFKEQNCDIVIFETGLGGRLDSTNIINPLVSIITSISLDHTNLLGPDLLSISREKAGIIKNNVPLICAKQAKEVKASLEESAYSKEAPLYISGSDFSFEIIKESETNIEFIYTFKKPDIQIQCRISSPIKEQVENASLALTASALLQELYPELTLPRLKKGIDTTVLKGRYHIFSTDPLIVFDPAHNRASLSSLYNTLNSNYPEHNLISVLTLMNDKEVDFLLKIVKLHSKKVFYLILNDERSYRPDKSIDGIDTLSGNQHFVDTVKKSLSNKSLVVLTGSFRMYNYAKMLYEELSNS